MQFVDIETIRKRISLGHYLIKVHAVQHALKEGFDRSHMVEAVVPVKLLRSTKQRSLFCGQVKLNHNISIYLHVICEYADPIYVEFVTAYIPDPVEWENPPFRRRRKQP